MKPSPQAQLFVAHKARKSRIVKRLMMTFIKLFMREKHASFLAALPDCFGTFVPENKRADPVYMKKLLKEITEDHYVYMIAPFEYFLLDFQKLSDIQKHAFVGELEKTWLCHSIRGNDWRILWDKNACYERFKPYFKRDALPVKSEADRDALFDFIRRHGAVMVKNARGSMGKNAQIIHHELSEMEAFWESLLHSFSAQTTYIAEELIVQSHAMAQFHPESVNTVRIMTFRKGSELVFLGALFRAGCGDSVVDNVGAGGILAEVDIRSGRMIGSGVSETGRRFDKHPDTGLRFPGYQIPRWNELLDLCRELAYVLEDQLYAGWDCALTDEGWVMVEGNSESSFGNQYPNMHGMREIVQDSFYTAPAFHHKLLHDL